MVSNAIANFEVLPVHRQRPIQRLRRRTQPLGELAAEIEALGLRFPTLAKQDFHYFV